MKAGNKKIFHLEALCVFLAFFPFPLSYERTR